MSRLYHSIWLKLHEIYRDTWYWFGQLNQQEWLLLLVVVTVLGFMCMRGFGSRNSY